MQENSVVFDSKLRLIGTLRASRRPAEFAQALFASEIEVQLHVMMQPGEDLIAALRGDEIDVVQRIRKPFFFEKKNQKTFIPAGTLPDGTATAT